MVDGPTTHRVEVTFVGSPPTRQIERAQGVSEVHLDGPLVRCLVCGSFQPFLEALRGYEVVSLTATLASGQTVPRTPRSEK
jgi:hypothetical protein